MVPSPGLFLLPLLCVLIRLSRTLPFPLEGYSSLPLFLHDLNEHHDLTEWVGVSVSRAVAHVGSVGLPHVSGNLQQKSLF